MRRRILNKLSWYLVLGAGIFQVLSFSLEQTAIQFEENLRNYDYEIIKSSHETEALSTMYKRSVNFRETFDDMQWIISATKFDNNLKRFFYYSMIFDQTRLLEDIVNDDSIKKYFKDETIFMNVPIEKNNKPESGTKTGTDIETAHEVDKLLREIDQLFTTEIEGKKHVFKPVNAIEVINEIIKAAHLFTEEINKKLNIDPDYYSEDFKTLVSGFQHVLNSTNHNLFNVIKKERKNVSTQIEEASKLGLLKQKLLLYSVFVQLLSLLFLLFLFRNISIQFMKKPKRKK